MLVTISNNTGEAPQMSVGKETVKALPPLGVTALDQWVHMPIEKWVAVATLVYVLCQIGCLFYDRIWGRPKRAAK